MRRDFPEAPFVCVFEELSLDPNLSHARRSVVIALSWFAGSGYSCSPTREEIAEKAGVGLSTVSRTIQWLIRIGAIVVEDDPFSLSGRVIRFSKRRIGDRRPINASTAGRAPGDKGARAQGQGGARPGTRGRAPGDNPPGVLFCAEEQTLEEVATRASRPSSFKSLKKEEKEENVPSSSVTLEPSHAGACEAGTARKTGRDGARAGNPDPDPASEGMPSAEQLADWERLKAEGKPLPLKARLWFAGRAQERDGLAGDVPLPAGVAPLPASVRGGSEPSASRSALEPARKPAQLRPDEAFPIADVLGMVRAIGEPQTDRGALARRIGAHLAARYREAGNPVTIQTFAAAALCLTADELAGEIRDCERAGVRQPGRLLAKRLGASLARARGIGERPAGLRAKSPDRPPGKEASNPSPSHLYTGVVPMSSEKRRIGSDSPGLPVGEPGGSEWAHEDSNFGPHPYQGCALAD